MAAVPGVSGELRAVGKSQSREVLRASRLGQLDPKHAIAVGGVDSASVGVGGELDLPGECAVVDFHQVDADFFAGGLRRVAGGNGPRPLSLRPGWSTTSTSIFSLSTPARSTQTR